MIPYLFLYLTILVVTSLSFHEISSTPQRRILLFLIFLLLSGFAGFRGTNVGTDTYSYHQMYDVLINAENPFLLGIEPSFVLLNLLGSYFQMGPQSIIILSSALIALLITRAAAKHSLNDLIFFSAFLGLSFYIFTFNGVRQSLAVACLFNALPLMSKKDNKASVWVLLAATFHVSAIIFLAALPLTRLRVKTSLWLLIWIASLGLMMWPSAIAIMLTTASDFLPPRYQGYITEELHMTTGTLAIRDLLYQPLFILTLFLSLHKNNNPTIRAISTLVLFGIILRNSLFHLGYIGRLSFYFEFFTAFHLGNIFMLINDAYHRYTASLVMAFIFLILYLKAISENSNGVFPYELASKFF